MLRALLLTLLVVSQSALSADATSVTESTHELQANLRFANKQELLGAFTPSCRPVIEDLLTKMSAAAMALNRQLYHAGVRVFETHIADDMSVVLTDERCTTEDIINARAIREKVEPLEDVLVCMAQYEDAIFDLVQAQRMADRDPLTANDIEEARDTSAQVASDLYRIRNAEFCKVLPIQMNTVMKEKQEQVESIVGSLNEMLLTASELEQALEE